jgi:hypothetical protein
MLPTFLHAADTRTLRVRLSISQKHRCDIFRFGLHTRPVYSSMDRGPHLLVDFMYENGANIALIPEHTVEQAMEIIRNRVDSIAVGLVLISMSYNRLYA